MPPPDMTPDLAPTSVRDLALPAPRATESLDRQLEASLQTPPVGRVVRLAALTLALTLIPFFGWASLTIMERAVIATGQLVPEGKRKTINLLEPGILRRLLVREAEFVDEGQPLLQLDVTQAESTADQARAAFWSGRARIARLRAEQAEQRQLVFPDEVTRVAATDPAIRVFLEAEEALFQARWSAADGAAAVQERQISQYQEQVNGSRAQREANEVSLRSAREQLVGMRTLQQQGLVSMFRLQEMQRLEQTYVGAIGQYRAQELQTRELITQAEKQLAGIRLDRLSQIATDLQTTEASTATAANQLRAAQDVLNRREVTSPEPGKVTNIRAFTPGATIAAGDAILDLVPVRDRFVVEMQVAPTDIEQVLVGQRVNARLTSYRTRQVPLIAGRLISVAADAVTSPQGAVYFPARAELDLEILARVPEIRLQAGMPAEVFILGEKRTPLDYIWAPIRNAGRRAFRD